MLRKNIHNLAGKPLIQHTIDAAIQSGVFKDIFVSSDCAEILEISKKLRATPLQRPENISGDMASTASTISHVIQTAGIAPKDTIVLLQPTSPLRTSQHIQEAVNIYLKNAIPVVSIQDEALYPDKYVVIAEDGVIHCKGNPAAPRQSIQPHYKPNGAIYIFSCTDFIACNEVPVEGALPFKMNPFLSLDIDVAEDFLLAELILENLDVFNR